ncbi:MAG: flagellar motor protein [Moorea sp. SIO2B7]|nr:flagellar motor protein [Moorena sp. SIO2B7]
MRKRSRHNNHSEDLNIWPSFTDLISNAFMILSVFLLLALFKSLFLKATAEQTQLNLSQTESQLRALQQLIANLEKDLKQRDNQLLQSTNQLKQSQIQTVNLRNQLQQSSTQLQQSSSQISQLEEKIARLKLAPPVVVIQDSGEYQFTSGSAALPKALRSYIETNLVDKIEQIAKERNIYVVEIIGHTDGQANVNSPSNLDQKLEDVAKGNKPVSDLSPGSNADLGLMRALEVVKELQTIQKKGRLNGLQFRAYSAAQLFLPSGNFAPINRDSDPNRRRIEIRFSPLGKAETIR